MRGEALEARLTLFRAARQEPPTLEARSALAEFLDRRNDPEARAAYEGLLALLNTPADSARRPEVLRRLVVLSLLAGDEAAANRHLEEYRAAGGKQLGSAKVEVRPPEDMPVVEIPGPLFSFARMAALTPDLAPEDLLPALARNVITNGYQASSSNEALDQTEYLKLVFRYLSQARELEKLAGADKHLRVEACESQVTGDLLRVIGFRMRGACGGDLVLETVNATRAFLTIDSGFPLAELEEALRTNRPFDYDFSPTRVPVLYGPDYWLPARDKRPAEFIDMFLGDPALCRLYLGLSKLDRQTAEELRKSVSPQRLRAFAHVLDFFGGMFLIRNGRVVVPGGNRAGDTWGELAGAHPSQGAAFLDRLTAKDDGWLTSYFDSLSRIEGPVLDYLTQPARMKRFYQAMRGRVTSPGPARPVFRSNTDLMLLTTRLRLEAGGSPHIPGGIEVWKNLFIKHPHGKYDGKLTKAAASWKDADDIVEALFALCRKAVENEPLKIFMALSDINRRRSEPLKPETVDRLARAWRDMGSQYSIYGEAALLSDETILLHLKKAEEVNSIRDQMLRANSAGTMQALVALWQILSRNGQIPEDRQDAALGEILASFGKLRNNRELFDAGLAGVRLLLKETGAPASLSVQDWFLDMLAGNTADTSSPAHQAVVQEMIRLFEAQRLISLQTLTDVANHLESLVGGGQVNTALLNRLATRIAEIQLPRASLTSVEKNALSFGYWTERHIEQQRKLNLRSLIERAGRDAEKIRDARGMLAPVLRDTLVGFVYFYYAPPGAQILRTNPLFVRGHDFVGVQGAKQTWRATEVLGSGWPSSAGGRLVGSLVGVPYALAEAEQNFLIPSREQALIWGDLVPQMIISAKVPRWWRVSPIQMHWVGLHLRLGETVLAESVLNPEVRSRLLAVLERRANPARAYRVDDFLARGMVRAARDLVTPAELYSIGAALAAGPEAGQWHFASEIARLSKQAPELANYAAASRAFGTPKPTLTNSYTTELLQLRTFPTLMGYSSRIMAESWESNILYFTALADELHMPPAQLNVVIPEWTQQTVERIFATHLEDWPALLRSLRLVGNDVRAKTRQEMSNLRQASLRE